MMKILFIGNSATYVHEIPQTLQWLAGQSGHPIEIGQITPGGCELAMHANAETEHGQRVLREIAKGYDVVFLQDNGNCISCEEKREACIRACRELSARVWESGGVPYLYVRPPYGRDAFGRSPWEQCVSFDALFTEIGRENGAVCAYVNRAFAYAMKNLPYELWGEDHAHTSPHGAYLAVCVFYTTLFGTSAMGLSPNGLSTVEALMLRNVANKIVLEQYCPW